MIHHIRRGSCLLLVLALLFGSIAFSEALAPAQDLEALLANMSLRDKLALMMFFSP